jgi:hypothetical protein
MDVNQTALCSDPGDRCPNPPRHPSCSALTVPTRFRHGQTVRCEVNGPVIIVGISDAPILWPVCKRGKWLVPVVYRGLAKAVRREAEQAVSHWWGSAYGPSGSGGEPSASPL